MMEVRREVTVDPLAEQKPEIGWSDLVDQPNTAQDWRHRCVVM